MGFGLTLVSFSASTTVRSTDMNSNFNAFNNASSFTGQVISNGGLSGSVTVGAGSNLTFSVGSTTMSGISQFSGTGGGTFNHGLSVTPGFFGICYSGTFGTGPTTILYWFNATSSQVTIHAQASYSWLGMAYAT